MNNIENIQIIDEPTTCPNCGSDDLGVCCATPEREDEADIVACEKCDWQAPLTPEGAANLATARPAVTPEELPEYQQAFLRRIDNQNRTR